MGFARGLRAVAGASGDGPIDWAAVEEAAIAATEPGELSLTPAERAAYGEDVRLARDRIGDAIGIAVELPNEIQIQHRHHWIRANITTFERLLRPLEDHPSRFPSVTRTLNTGSMAASISFLARHVLGQYDPLLLAAESADPRLYFVDPNVRRVARILEVDLGRFRRWIAFHEVAHAAEFSAAPWLPGHLEERMERAIEELAAGRFPRDTITDLQVTMTVIEGYAEFMMDRSFDGDASQLRAAVEKHRDRRGRLDRAIQRILGMEMKRQQYEVGRRFFEEIEAHGGATGPADVWTDPAMLPTEDELDAPAEWLGRVA